MTILEDELRGSLSARAHALRVPERPDLDRDIVDIQRDSARHWLLVAVCLALVVGGVVALVVRESGGVDPAPPLASIAPDTPPATTAFVPPVPPVVSDSAASVPGGNGWVAVESGDFGAGDISLVRLGGAARRLEVAGSETGDDACPAWSPDGTRLLFGRLTASSGGSVNDAQLVIVPVDPDGSIGAPTIIALDGFGVLDGHEPHPCAIWAPDGRWVAFGGRSEVWVVDTNTREIRRLPNLRPSDLEWRPGTDQVAIAGDLGVDRSAPTLSTPVTVYAVSTGEFRQVGSVEAAQLTWSPDGSVMAFQGGETDPDTLWLVDADGANERVLVADTGPALHGIGPVWSPAGDRIAYQRLCCNGAETHEVVLVDVADGSQKVIEPPETADLNTAVWYPFYVTWSPDGTTLLYTAWSSAGQGVIAVHADPPHETTVLTDMIGAGGVYSHGWAPTQMWAGYRGAWPP